jgi:hypothetical protein
MPSERFADPMANGDVRSWPSTDFDGRLWKSDLGGEADLVLPGKDGTLTDRNRGPAIGKLDQHPDRLGFAIEIGACTGSAPSR